MMEKYDGVRVYWDGQTLHANGQKYSKSAYSKLQTFPSIPFDGELWYAYLSIVTNYNRMGPNKRNDCIPFLKGKMDDWTNVKIMIFDAPNAMDRPYSERIRLIQSGTYIDYYCEIVLEISMAPLLAADVTIEISNTICTFDQYSNLLPSHSFTSSSECSIPSNMPK
jgi:hypothetical protein